MDDPLTDDDNAALAAALEAAEQAHAANTSAPPPPPVKQPVPQKVSRSGSSAIVVNPRQKGNPILTHIKNIPWEYGSSDLLPDYLLGQTTCALFLSLKYHRLHPEYIYTRLKPLQNHYNLRILLTIIDIENHQDSLKELTKTSLINNLTLILCWTSAEAGRYLETFKSYEYSAPTLIQEKQSTEYGKRVVEVLTQVRSVNKVDAVALVSTFGSLRGAVNARPEEVIMISGWGQQKVKRFERAVGERFRVAKTNKSKSTLASQTPRVRARARGDGNNNDGVVAAKLGIGPTIQTPAAAAVEESKTTTTIEIEDEEAAAEAEAAEEEASRKKTNPPPPLAETVGVSTVGIMDALGKLRER